MTRCRKRSFAPGRACINLMAAHRFGPGCTASPRMCAWTKSPSGGAGSGRWKKVRLLGLVRRCRKNSSNGHARIGSSPLPTITQLPRMPIHLNARSCVRLFDLRSLRRCNTSRLGNARFWCSTLFFQYSLCHFVGRLVARGSSPTGAITAAQAIVVSRTLSRGCDSPVTSSISPHTGQQSIWAPEIPLPALNAYRIPRFPGIALTPSI
jgi:hypothetical protein